MPKYQWDEWISSSIKAQTREYLWGCTVCKTLYTNFLMWASKWLFRDSMEDEKTKALKFTESPKVTFSGSGKEPSVLTSSLGFLPENPDAYVKSNTLRTQPCLLFSSFCRFSCSLLPTYLFSHFSFIKKILIKDCDCSANPPSSFKAHHWFAYVPLLL